MVPPKDHDCAWRDHATKLEEDLSSTKSALDETRQQLAALQAQMDQFQRQMLGPKSEKMPSVQREIDKERSKEERQAEARRKRKERQVAKTELATDEVELEVPDDERQCPCCGNDKLRRIGKGKPSTLYDYVPGYFRRRIYRRETLSCRCGEYVVTAPAPDRVTDGTQYGPGLIAHLIIAKCADSIPLYRLEKQYRRVGLPLARSTMTDLFHRHAELLAPIGDRILERVAQSEVVLADETSIKMLGTTKRAFLWTFNSGNLIGYRFSKDRSGQTPVDVLGGTQGTLVVDMYTGYNRVVGVEGRERAGCLAHARRKLFDAVPNHPEANEGIDLIREIYRIEHNAREQGVVGTEEHRQMREFESLPWLDKLYVWLAKQKDLHPPRSQMGRAVSYAMNNWQALTRFIKNPKIPPDNNRSEAALRVVALGRKNYLFVGNEDAGNNVAALYSIVATCEACGVNPYAYLRDVLMRISTHPAKDIDALLPDAWQPRD